RNTLRVSLSLAGLNRNSAGPPLPPPAAVGACTSSRRLYGPNCLAEFPHRTRGSKLQAPAPPPAVVDQSGRAEAREKPPALRQQAGGGAARRRPGRGRSVGGRGQHAGRGRASSLSRGSLVLIRQQDRDDRPAFVPRPAEGLEPDQRRGAVAVVVAGAQGEGG